MVNGQFKCLGSIQHLKNKYGSGYTLQAKVRKDGHSNHQRTSPTSLSTSEEEANSPDPHIGNRGGVSTAPPTDESDTTRLHAFINDTFPGAILLEEHQGEVTYQLCNEMLSWATVFREMERHRERLGVIDYSVSQTTLEQVFINFAKDQAEVEEVA
jgi:ATP-binding cassette subfamily A (ABC1) protein 3